MIHFLHGPNEYALATETRRLRDDFVLQKGADGYQRVDSESLPATELPQLLLGVSLFTPSRMVVIKNSSSNKPLWEALEQWINKVPEALDLVLIEPHPDKRTKTFKTILSNANHIFEAKDINEAQATTWLIAEALKRGNKQLSRNNAQLLVARIGTDQAQLSTELDKLLVHDDITQQLITALTVITPQVSAYELLDAVIARQPKKAQQILNQLSTIEDPYRLYGLFSSQVFTLASVVAAGKKVEPAQIAKDTGSYPFVISKLAHKASSMAWSDVKSIIDETASLDDMLKRSGIDPWELISSRLLKIAAR